MITYKIQDIHFFYKTINSFSKLLRQAIRRMWKTAYFRIHIVVAKVLNLDSLGRHVFLICRGKY